jgi:hypothetical protein
MQYARVSLLRVAIPVACLCAAAASAGQSPTEKRLDLRIRPAIATEPGAIRVTALVERHLDNTALTFTAECPDYLRRSRVQLDGDTAARSHTVVFEHLPACVYEISATLHRRDGDDLVELREARVTR